ncbi:hypothetical protein FHS15_001299 [Paenibacillus castaneae]|uniref:hypothetical protein n=1 Tax=Paenibacillus castaneae TaxID=474957 RepID=UPI000C9AA699|nr:hypothetical protein [Paenibacillus castaneae]NIK76192.1 hypothetical protein [Paenibacillus castaneae]
MIYGMIAAVGFGIASVAQPGELDYAMFLTMVFGSFMLQLAIGSIVFLSRLSVGQSESMVSITSGDITIVLRHYGGIYDLL